MPHCLILLILVCGMLAPIQAAETVVTAKSEAIDLTRDGSYTSGAWTYRLRVYNPGTRSQATVGSMVRDGLEVKPPADGKPVETPWGAMAWHGERGTLETGGKPWGDFGWRPAVNAKQAELDATRGVMLENIEKTTDR